MGLSPIAAASSACGVFLRLDYEVRINRAKRFPLKIPSRSTLDTESAVPDRQIKLQLAMTPAAQSLRGQADAASMLQTESALDAHAEALESCDTLALTKQVVLRTG